MKKMMMKCMRKMKHMMMIETKQKRIETYNNDRNLTAEDDEGSPIGKDAK